MPKKKTTHRHIKKATVADHHMHMKKRSGHIDFGFIDRLIVFSGPLIPIAAFFQAYTVLIQGKADGLSIITWSLLLFASFTMAVYAIYHRTKPLVMVYIPLVLANGLVVLGILIHR